MTPGEAAESTLRYGGTYGNRRIARALVEMRAAVHAIHWRTDDGTCAACPSTYAGNGVGYVQVAHPCATIRAVEAVWGGDQ